MPNDDLKQQQTVEPIKERSRQLARFELRKQAPNTFPDQKPRWIPDSDIRTPDKSENYSIRDKAPQDR